MPDTQHRWVFGISYITNQAKARKENRMNIRKNIDYSEMYAALDALLESIHEQTKLFCEIGRVIDERPEKGAAVAAAEYICAAHPDMSGFSPRGLRRMRDFYRAYKNDLALMAEAMNVSWTLNALIIEKCEEDEVRRWYIRACMKFGWSKQELNAKINENAHEHIKLDIEENVCYTKCEETVEVRTAPAKGVLSAEVSYSMYLPVLNLATRWLRRQTVFRIGKWRLRKSPLYGRELPTLSLCLV